MAATALGPIAAVLVSLFRESRNAIRERRLFVFRTLMSTRKQLISVEHVGALNLVEVEFYGCKDIEKSWKNYLSHLNTDPEINQAKWIRDRDNLLALMLSEMSKILGYKYDTLEIYQGGYSPGGWAHRDAVSFGALEYIRQLSAGQKTVPISILDQPKDNSNTTKDQSEH